VSALLTPDAPSVTPELTLPIRFHFGQSFLTPQECAEHTSAVELARHFHPCPDCDGGKHKLNRCRKCEGRGFAMRPAVARKWGLPAVLALDEHETDPNVQAHRARAAYEEDPRPLCPTLEELYTDFGADVQEGGNPSVAALEQAVAAHQAECGECGR
jgi:hypothetical protein